MASNGIGFAFVEGMERASGQADIPIVKKQQALLFPGHEEMASSLSAKIKAGATTPPADEQLNGQTDRQTDFQLKLTVHS